MNERQDGFELKAIPERVYKVNLVMDYNVMLEKQKAMINTYLTSKRYADYEVYDFATSMIKLFNSFRMMIQDKMETKKKNKEEYAQDKVLFDTFRKLQLNQIKLNHPNAPVRLMELMNFLIKYMHECNLTNLLIESNDSIDDYERNY